MTKCYSAGKRKELSLICLNVDKHQAVLSSLEIF